MPWLDNRRDWPHAMAGWDDGRRARHAAHAARFVAEGWAVDTASIVAFDLVLEEEADVTGIRAPASSGGSSRA